ncbi:MAG: SDR family oxidoreductase [Candidatus Omnitrophica bacterium]|nr:SDR family oxidoreductase [Candidatus Omnitrophota bacterium]
MSYVKNVLMTGCTGNLGSHILKRFLINTFQDVKLFLLVRGENKEHALKRVEEACPWTNDFKKYVSQKKVQVLPGDISKENLGLAKRSYDELLKEIDVVYHSAALTRFNDPLAQLRRVNVLGTQRILDFIAKSRRSPTLHYISTAFIAGDYKGLFKESDFDLGQKFNNPYEQSKFEAEKRVRKFQKGRTNVHIYRPSIIVGEYDTGRTLDFQMFYKPLYLLSKEVFQRIAVRKNTRLNLIPVDRAANAIWMLAHHMGERKNKIYHIVSPKPLNIISTINRASEYFHFAKPKLGRSFRFKNPIIARLYLKKIRPFFNYFTFQAQFDCGETSDRLEELGFSFPELDRLFLERLFAYAVKMKYMGIN